MSDIKQIDEKIIVGRINAMEMNPINGSTSIKVDITGTITNENIWTDCILCKKQVYTGHRFMDEGICESCRDKVKNRLNLIINFE